MPLLPQTRILAVAPCSRGFGFAMMDGKEVLADWGVKTVKKAKNASALTKLKEMILHFDPDVIVLHDLSADDSRRSARVRRLGGQISALASRHKVSMRLFSREELKEIYFPDAQGTKHELAEVMAKEFPAELGHRLPPKRRPWMSEDYRMSIFEAVALALALRRSKTR